MLCTGAIQAKGGAITMLGQNWQQIRNILQTKSVTFCTSKLGTSLPIILWTRGVRVLCQTFRVHYVVVCRGRANHLVKDGLGPLPSPHAWQHFVPSVLHWVLGLALKMPYLFIHIYLYIHLFLINKGNTTWNRRHTLVVVVFLQLSYLFASQAQTKWKLDVNLYHF